MVQSTQRMTIPVAVYTDFHPDPASTQSTQRMTIPVAVYTESIFSTMSIKPARNTKRFIIEINE
jgi:hypothetical protein